MAQSAAEELPVLTYLYLVLVSALMWALFRALKAGWKLTFGGLLTGLGNILNYDYRFIHIHFGGPILALEADIENALTRAAHGYEQAMGFWFWEMAHLQLWIVDETWKLSKDLLHLGGWIVHTYIPTYVEGWGHALHGTQRTLIREKTRIERKVSRIENSYTLPYAGRWAWLNRNWKALRGLVAAAGAIAAFPPITIPRLWDSIHDLRKWRTHVNKRLHKLEVAAGAAAFAALMANVLGVSARCVRSRGPLGKFARAWCGLDDLLAAALIADLAVNLEHLSLEDFARAVQKTAPLAATSLVALVDEIPIAVDEAEAIGKRALRILESVA